MKIYHLYESDKPKKKFYVEFVNPDTNRKKRIYFGSAGMSDMSQHGDESRKANYMRRHQAREDWYDLSTAGAWAKHLLWNLDTLSKSIKDMEKRFDIKIIKKY